MAAARASHLGGRAVSDTASVTRAEFTDFSTCSHLIAAPAGVADGEQRLPVLQAAP